MIHYSGKTTKRPNLIACTTKSPQATANDWHSTDCPNCRMSLMGMTVAPREDSTKRGFVADFDAVSVVIETPAADGESAPDATRVSWDGFDNRWVRSDV
jgi:hypothetical protein